jgi:hypothetical protein
MHLRPSALLTVLAFLLGFGHDALAQYTKAAGKNAPMAPVAREVRGDDGVIRTQIVDEKPAADRFGNANGNSYDLAIDGAFEGQTVAVIQLYTGGGFDFHLPKAALKQKGFSVYRWSNSVPSPADLEKALAKSSQLWIISGDSKQLTAAHLAVIRKFFEAGHGLYIWGDNVPYYGDANFVAQGLFGASMEGSVQGEQTVGVQKKTGTPGLLPNHLLTTGLENIYEGHTIATIQPNKQLAPLIYGSAGNLVTAYYDHDGKRAIFDGGFTRLYLKWDTAGTARYVKNAASWLVNAERFGDAVVAIKSEPGAAVPTTSIPTIAMTTTVATPAIAPHTTAQPSMIASRAFAAVLIAAILSCLLLLVVPRVFRRA